MNLKHDGRQCHWCGITVDKTKFINHANSCPKMDDIISTTKKTKKDEQKKDTPVSPYLILLTTIGGE